MCEYCHQEYCCIHGRHHYYYPRYPYPPAPVYYERTTVEARHEFLEDEKRLLQKRLKEIEERLAESTK